MGAHLRSGRLCSEAQAVGALHVLEGRGGASPAAPHALPLRPPHAPQHGSAKLLDGHCSVCISVRLLRKILHAFLHATQVQRHLSEQLWKPRTGLVRRLALLLLQNPPSRTKMLHPLEESPYRALPLLSRKNQR